MISVHIFLPFIPTTLLGTFLPKQFLSLLFLLFFWLQAIIKLLILFSLFVYSLAMTYLVLFSIPKLVLTVLQSLWLFWTLPKGPHHHIWKLVLDSVFETLTTHSESSFVQGSFAMECHLVDSSKLHKITHIHIRHLNPWEEAAVHTQAQQLQLALCSQGGQADHSQPLFVQVYFFS